MYMPIFSVGSTLSLKEGDTLAQGSGRLRADGRAMATTRVLYTWPCGRDRWANTQPLPQTQWEGTPLGASLSGSHNWRTTLDYCWSQSWPCQRCAADCCPLSTCPRCSETCLLAFLFEEASQSSPIHSFNPHHIRVRQVLPSPSYG